MKATRLDEVIGWHETLESAQIVDQFQVPNFLRPYHFAILASVAHRKGSTGMRVPQALQAYAARMRLWQAIGLPPPASVNERNPGGRFHPLTAIDSESAAEACADAVRNVFGGAGRTDANTLKGIGIMLSEIFGNCHFHAESKTTVAGLACAQTWPAGDLAQVAVADAGIGIRASLGKNPSLVETLGARNACELATELGVTGKPAGQHSGFGLTVARQLVAQGGKLMVLSGDEAFVSTASDAKCVLLACPVVGTIVIMEWILSQPLDIGLVYGSWPNSGRDSDGEYF
jgi:hypothetical protein